MRDDRNGVLGAGAVGAKASYVIERSDREVEARFRQFAAMAPIGVIFMDADGRATYVNQRWSEITGYTTEQGLGGGWIRAIHKEDRAFVLESTRPALVRGRTTDIVHRIVRPSGEIAWVRGRAAAVLGPDASVIGFTASVEDISSEREARAESERLAQILEQTTEFVSIIDVSGRLLYANERLRQFFGIEPGVDITQSSTAATRVTEDSRRRLTKEALTSLRRNGTWTGELELISAQGDTVTILQSSRMHHDEAGNPAFVSGIGRDVTELKEAQRRLEASEARFRSIAQHSNDLVAVVDMSGRYVYTSPSHHRVIGYTPEELLGRSPLDLLHPDDRKRAEREFTVQILSETRAEPTPIEFRHRHSDGGWRYIEAIASNLATDPAVGGVIVNARDVTDRRRSADLSTAQAAILERAARHAPLDETVSAVADMIEPWIDGSVVIGLLDDDGSTFRIAAAHRFPQECIDEVDGMSLSVPQWTQNYGDERVFHGDVDAFSDLPSLAIPLRAAGFHTWSGILIRQSEAHDPLGAVYVISQSDRPLGAEDAKLLEIAADLAALCIERTRTADRLNHLALHDALTGLPNRALVTERLERVAVSTQGDQSAAVLFLDLDRFKVINDSIGHDAGDRILVDLGRRLRAELRPRDLVGRFGGDEFVIIAEQLHATSAALELAQRILEIVRRPNSFGDRELIVTASIGVAMVDRGDADALLRDADAAMYAAKAGGRARVELFTPELHARATTRLETEGGLRRALAMNELVMHYQPAVALESGVLLGFEALIRWQHPTRGLLSADDFMGVAEETGLLRSIGLFAIEEACRQGAKWLQHAGWGAFVMGVNASGSQFADPGFVTELEAILERTGMPPRFLAIEITERTIIDEGRVAQDTMLELRGRGIGLVLDDFGTGYSSLVHLKRFPIQTLKIDRSFVEGMATNADDRAIVGAVVALGRQLGLFTVAEGVQTAEQRTQLREVGCDIAQGNWWCQPLPGPAIEQLLGDRSPVAFPGRH